MIWGLIIGKVSRISPLRSIKRSCPKGEYWISWFSFFLLAKFLLFFMVKLIKIKVVIKNYLRSINNFIHWALDLFILPDDARPLFYGEFLYILLSAILYFNVPSRSFILLTKGTTKFFNAGIGLNSSNI